MSRFIDDPAVDVKEYNSIPAIEFISPAHQLLQLALKSPITVDKKRDKNIS